jgi:hypothetical protein
LRDYDENYVGRKLLDFSDKKKKELYLDYLGAWDFDAEDYESCEIDTQLCRMLGLK